jgi:hypothetical protein
MKRLESREAATLARGRIESIHPVRSWPARSREGVWSGRGGRRANIADPSGARTVGLGYCFDGECAGSRHDERHAEVCGCGRSCELVILV